MIVNFNYDMYLTWRRKWQPTTVFLPKESCGQRSLGGLLSVGSHRVGHAWIDLAAAAGDNTLQVFGNVNCPITGDLGAHGKLQSPLPSVKNTTDPLRRWLLFKINISFYLFVLLLHCSMWDLVNSCGMWDLVPWPGVEPRPPALAVWSLSPWTTREVPSIYIL